MRKVAAACRNELIIKRRKRRLRKKCFMLSAFFIIVGVVLCYKLSYFNIKSIDVDNNKAVSTKDIIKMSGINIGDNIFYVKSSAIKSNITQDPYIESVDVFKVLPSKISIKIHERQPAFYIKKDKVFYLVDKNGFILAQKDYFNCNYLMEIKNEDKGSLKVGERLSFDDVRCYDLLKQLSDIECENRKNFAVSAIDISNILDIKAYCNKFCIMIGDPENLPEKFNKAMLILKSKELKNANGYVDVSYEGNPVFLIRK